MKTPTSLHTFFFILLFSILSANIQAEPETQAANSSSININSATAEQIAKHLKGVGLKKAKAIIDYRESYGEFYHIDELTAVKGIGKNTVAKNAHLINVE